MKRKWPMWRKRAKVKNYVYTADRSDKRYEAKVHPPIEEEDYEN